MVSLKERKVMAERKVRFNICVEPNYLHLIYSVKCIRHYSRKIEFVRTIPVLIKSSVAKDKSDSLAA